MLRRFTKAERLFSRAQRLAAQHQYNAAVEAFGGALALQPRAAGMALHQALALAETAQISTAIATLQEAMRWQPDNPVLPLFVGQLCFDAADYGQAKHWCVHTLALAPYNPYALGLQALVDMALGHIPVGYACLRQPLPLPMTMAERTVLRLTRSRSPSLTIGQYCPQKPPVAVG
jgi:tetratricopeptide (TPR) repeat protein